MATKKATSTLYHLSSGGFWKKFRDLTAVNPEISSGLPLQDVNRFPPPASRPERYSTPATKASDPAQNPYWKRDVRRAHPQLSVVTQSQLSQLLIEHSGTETVVAPEDTSQVTVKSLEPTTLSQAIAAVTGTTKVYSEDKLPPSPPISFQRWEPVRSDDAPHAPFSYFPMVMYH
ncbi:hypothetical protein Ac2012v2_004913 [Leucoagaricus gongylophorus]